MKLSNTIHTFPTQLKLFLGAFVIVLSIGYFTGLLFVNQTSGSNPSGIEENYLGNEDIEYDTNVMKFKKGEREMLTIIHTHILSMSFIFFLLGGILYTTNINKKLKSFLMIEPFFSVLITFGGIYLMWTGLLLMKYIVMLSGILMTASFTASAIIILVQLFAKSTINKE
jgi:hypothetical protein